MAFAALSDHRSLATTAQPDQRAGLKLSGFWARLTRALMEARQREADREIARLIELRGGVFTADVEREIERRFL